MTLEELKDLLCQNGFSNNVMTMMELGGEDKRAAVDGNGDVFLWRGELEAWPEDGSIRKHGEWQTTNPGYGNCVYFCGNIGKRDDWQDLVIEVK